jgi:ribulose-phosphate 3-epimerase
VDLVLIMTVEPGFGGQKFMADMMDKVHVVRAMLDLANPGCDVEVDGGVDPLTATLCKTAGANVLVAGSAVFGKTDRAAAIEAIRNS